MMATFETEVKKLNKAQKEAVQNIEGPLMVLAGPGTGKTQVVALRIAQILKATQLNPNNILALTFTEAGVTALRQRLVSLIGQTAYQISVNTFHGLASEVIGSFRHVFARITDGSQLNEIDRIEILTKLLSDKKYSALKPLRRQDHYIADIIRAIKTCKQESVKPSVLRDLVEQEYQAAQAETTNKIKLEAASARKDRLIELSWLFEEYEQYIEANGQYDWEDMILLTTDAIKNNAELRAHFQEKYQYILVDEYQDTNNAQSALVYAIAEFFSNPNLCVVGDDKQAIYRFQGASVANLIDFKTRFPSAGIVSLTENYRSTQNILDGATRLIASNTQQLVSFLPQINQLLTAASQAKPIPVTLVTTQTELAELAYLQELLKDESLGSVAVLWRKNAEANRCREVLIKAKIAVAGEEQIQLSDSPTARQLILFLQSVLDPTDQVALEGTLLAQADEAEYLGLLELFKVRSSWTATLAECDLVKTKENFQRLIALSQSAPVMSVEAVINEVLSWSNIRQHLLGKYDLDSAEAVGTIINLARQFENRQDSSIKSFLSYLKVGQLHRQPILKTRLQSSGGVFVGTAHSAKGLEFDTVVIAGATDKAWGKKTNHSGLKLPSSILPVTNWVEDETEEERRLFYVAATRAKRRLIFSYSQTDQLGRDQLPSRFVSEFVPETKEEFIIDVPENVWPAILLPSVKPSRLAYFRERIAARPFSYTDLQSFSECPQQYLIRVLGLPTERTVPLSYGNLVHSALERFFKEFKYRKSLPNEQYLLQCIDESARAVPLELRSSVIEHARNVLTAYYQAKSDGWKIPEGIEYSFTPHQVHLDDIWLTGKFDRFEIIQGNNIRVFDYKTKSEPLSRNAILGKTQSSDGYIKQLMFYALLAETDSQFPFTVKEFAICFIDDKLKFTEEVFTISQNELKEIRQEVKAVYQQILNEQTFAHLKSDFELGCSSCLLYNLV